LASNAWASPEGDPSDDPASTVIPTPEELEKAGAVIGHIVIINSNVFDTSVPEDNKALFRLANRLHIRTRGEVIRGELLITEGQLYSDRLVKESERILRANRYLYDAQIVPFRYHDNKVDLEVRSRDVWTLKPGISFGRSGGNNSTSFQVEESNFLGRGKEINIERKSDVDRTETTLRYTDPHVWGTWNQFSGMFSDNSDGKLREVTAAHPFYSLDSRWAAALLATDWDRIDSRYDRGHVIGKFNHRQEILDLSFGLSRGLVGGRAFRWTAGAAYESDRFDLAAVPLGPGVLPQERRLAYPFVGLEMVEDRYEERRNQDQIDRTEDYYAGKLFRARLGYASTAYGSDRNAVIVKLDGGTSFEPSPAVTIMADAKAAGRLESGSLKNATLAAEAKYYWRISDRQLSYVSLSGTVTEDLDAEHQLLLGGDNGLRGYPLRYQDGTSMALLTLEHRIYSDYYLFRLFHVGGAVFFDAGRTWGRGNGAPSNEGMLKDVGLGLRLGQSRSAFGNVIHVDLAFPLDGDPSINKVQFVVETKRSF